MELIFDFLSSVNKIAIVAFFCVIGFLCYEIYQLTKEKQKKTKPTLPQLVITQSAPYPTQVKQSFVKPKEIAVSTNHSRTLIIIGALAVLFLLIGYIVVTAKKIQLKKETTAQKVTIIQEISSDGVRIFTPQWLEIGKDMKMVIRPGDTVYIGVQTISEADIDRARIRINETNWQINHITTQYNQKNKVYYKEYTVATGESQLKIDAQLHSASDGWLGE